MSFDKKSLQHTLKTHESILLNAAECVLAIGAAFGFFAVMALVLFSWSMVLVATVVVIIAVVVALILWTLPSYLLTRIRFKKKQ